MRQTVTLSLLSVTAIALTVLAFRLPVSHPGAMLAPSYGNGVDITAVDFLEWAWQRHHNILSWYIRPLFLLPLAWFAWRRSGFGITLTLVALATSMFWFPAPATPDPRVEEFLAFEQEWLTGQWTPAKVALTLVVPVGLAAYCLAFWRRSVRWGLALLNLMAVGKLVWGVAAGSGTGWAMTVPLLSGLLLCDIVMLSVLRRRPRKTSTQSNAGSPT